MHFFSLGRQIVEDVRKRGMVAYRPLPTLLTAAKPLSATTVWDKRESFCSSATNGGNGNKFATECSAAKDEVPATKARREKR